VLSKESGNGSIKTYLDAQALLVAPFSLSVTSSAANTPCCHAILLLEPLPHLLAFHTVAENLSLSTLFTVAITSRIPQPASMNATSIPNPKPEENNLLSQAVVATVLSSGPWGAIFFFRLNVFFQYYGKIKRRRSKTVEKNSTHHKQSFLISTTNRFEKQKRNSQ